MREIVYVSDKTLSQFDGAGGSGRKRTWGWLRSIGVKAPFSMGEVTLGVDDSGRDGPSLEKVIRYLERQAQIRWYEESSVEVGDWVQFEAKMNYTVVDVSEKHLPMANGEQRLVLFWQPLSDEDVRSPRLLLLGHPEGLIDDRPDLAALSGGSLSTSDILHRILPPIVAGEPSAPYDTRMITLDLAELSLELDVTADSTAAHYAGYARVIANLSSDNVECPPGWMDLRFMVASPLFVEHSAPPARGR